MKKCQYISHS